MFRFITNENNEVLKVQVQTNEGMEFLPLGTFSNQEPRYALDEMGYTYLHNVDSIPLRSLNGLQMSPHFISHRFNHWDLGDFVAIEIRNTVKMSFVTKPHEIIAATRELNLTLAN